MCEHFKVGQCAKGFKCKFSHDLNVQRKGEKIDIYSDKRDDGWYLKITALNKFNIFRSILVFNVCHVVLYLSEEKGTMEDWDQETLEKVVASRSNEYNKNKPTDIVSPLSLCPCQLSDGYESIFLSCDI